ncbi:unnamed protein product [Rhizophagus irregularis]|nr:unnamed protein product [Rhizophagus irregularis]
MYRRNPSLWIGIGSARPFTLDRHQRDSSRYRLRSLGWRNGLWLSGCFLNGTSKIRDFLIRNFLDGTWIELRRSTRNFEGLRALWLFGQLYDRILKVFGLLDGISKGFDSPAPGRRISKVHFEKRPGRLFRRSRMLKEFRTLLRRQENPKTSSGLPYRSFATFYCETFLTFFRWTLISKVKEAETSSGLLYRRFWFPFKELQRSPLFVGIEPTGTISKPLTTYV